jgi:hypothetical protein
MFVKDRLEGDGLSTMSAPLANEPVQRPTSKADYGANPYARAVEWRV